MKFTCLQENLSKGVQTAARAIPTKSLLPVLSNILITVENGNLKLSATNTELAITANVGASVEDGGSITVPAKLFKEFITNLPPSAVKVELINDILHVSSDKTKSKFNCTTPQDYPEFPKKPGEEPHLEIDPKIFCDAALNVTFSAGTDDSRPAFTGVYLNFSKGVLTIAATDGYRLSEKLLPVAPAETKKTAEKRKGKTKEEGKEDKEKTNGEFTCVIPAKNMAEIARIFSGCEEPLKIYLNESENLAIFESGDYVVATRVLDEKYPDYKRIIPPDSTLKAVFSSVDFLDAVKLTNIFAKETDSTVKIRFDPEGYVKIVTIADETGGHESSFDAEVEGDAAEIAFNAKYLLDFLNNIKSEKLTFGTNGNVAPCVFKPHDHDGFLHIIMPLQI